jgi:hypothetical protein
MLKKDNKNSIIIKSNKNKNNIIIMIMIIIMIKSKIKLLRNQIKINNKKNKVIINL